ncbi:integrase core domain-containing protein [Klebsiella quasipneumoniae]|uniref:integrase core domain-containing protein n=1 Tax=Klebsiella quasipneumoniae TaxID=1463165 RepID=UPI0009837AF3
MYGHGVTLYFSRPENPTDNPFIEAVCVNFHWFLPQEDAQDKLAKWRREYNHEREHSSLNDTTLAEFIRSLRKDEDL